MNKINKVKYRNESYDLNGYKQHFTNHLDFLEELVNNETSHEIANKIWKLVENMAEHQFNHELKAIKTSEQEKDKYFSQKVIEKA